MEMRPCPICETPMTIRSVDADDHHHDSFFVYCRQCGYGPVETFPSAKQAAEHWDERSIGRSNQA